MFYIALSLYILFLIGYTTFIIVILYHAKRYKAPGEKIDIITKMIFIFILILVILSLVAFINVPWEEIKI